MSLVLGYASKDSAIIMSDGRATGDFPSETKNKTEKINDNIILGYVGFAEDAKTFLDFTYDALGDYRKEIRIDEFLEYTSRQIDSQEAREYFHSTFMIIGRDPNDRMVFSEIGHYTGHRLIKRYIDADPYGTHIGGTIGRTIIQRIFQDKMKHFTGDNIVPIYKDIICIVSDLDKSVNSNCYIAQI